MGITFKCGDCGEKHERVDITDLEELSCCWKRLVAIDHIHLYDSEWGDFGCFCYKEDGTPCLVYRNMMDDNPPKSIDELSKLFHERFIAKKKEPEGLKWN